MTAIATSGVVWVVVDAEATATSGLTVMVFGVFVATTGAAGLGTRLATPTMG